MARPAGLTAAEGLACFWAMALVRSFCLLALGFLAGFEQVGLAFGFALAAAFGCQAVGFGLGPFVEGFFFAGSAPGFFHSLDAHGFVVRFFLFVFVDEVFVIPDVRTEWSFVECLGVKDDVVHVRLEAGAGEVGAGGLQGVEEEAGGFAVDLAGDDEAHDLHERDLDGVGVFEDGEGDGDIATAGAIVL